MGHDRGDLGRPPDQRLAYLCGYSDCPSGCCRIGLINGLCITRLNMSPFVPTLFVVIGVLSLSLAPINGLQATGKQRTFAIVPKSISVSFYNDSVTILYISHRLPEVFALCDTLTVLRDGRHVRTLKVQESNEAEVARLMVGRELLEFHRTKAEKPNDVVLWREPAESASSQMAGCATECVDCR
jgi:hypothetical protein